MNGITSNRSSERVPTDVSVAPAARRLMSLDAFRGAIMLLMASSGFGVPQVANPFATEDLPAVLSGELFVSHGG